MVKKFNIRKFIRLTTIAIILLATSFLNYCLMQIFGAYFMPLTAIVLFIAEFSQYNLPITMIAGIGLLDDLLSNGYLGLYAFIYLSLSYFMSTKLQDIANKKYLIISFLVVFALINIFTFSKF